MSTGRLRIREPTGFASPIDGLEMIIHDPPVSRQIPAVAARTNSTPRMITPTRGKR